MLAILLFVNALAVAGFAGGCLCLSIALGALLGGDPDEGARVMRLLLPRMGSLMAPLLGASMLSALVLAVGSLRAKRAARGGDADGRELRRRWLVVGSFFAILVVTVSVHLPLNAALLEAALPTPARASLVLERWLLWHHVRTALALFALGVLLWPLQAARSARGAATEALQTK